VFEIGGGRVEVYPGNYEDFLWRKQGGAEKLQEQVEAVVHSPEPGNGHVAAGLLTRPADQRNASANGEKPTKRLNPIKRKQMEERAAELEQEISSLESAVAQCEASLQTFVSAEETTRLSRELEQNRAELQERIAEWEQIGQELSANA
jgi:ATP-binding cassette, subfamily F, member 3